MSNTRTAEPGKAFRQERYASSAQLDRGLLANLVARRCAALDRAEDRELIWFLQLLSWREGGLKKVAAELLAMFPENIGTASMLKFGVKPGRFYNAEQVHAVRKELHSGEGNAGDFPLKGEVEFSAADFLDVDRGDYAERERAAANHPSRYPVEDFVEACAFAAAGELEADLKTLCLDPAVVLHATADESFKEFAPWYFQNAGASLRGYMVQCIAQRRAAVVVTELGRQVYETLDYSLESRCMVLLDGFARTGKTFATKAWCELHPGRVRYAQVTSTNDEIGFYRAMAKSLGVSINLNSKAQELRQRIEEVLQAGDLMLVLDEAHYLWPNSNYRDAMPTRVNWVLTALVNQGVPVALVTTPQFLRTQKAVERKSSWTSEQFVGRIGHYQRLPDSLTEADLRAVAEAQLPEGDAKAIQLLVSYAQGSAKYLAGIESVVRRARFIASKAGRREVSTADVKRAIQDGVIPSDSALAQAIAQPERPNSRRSEARLKQPFRTLSTDPESAARPSAPVPVADDFTARRPSGSRADLDPAPPLRADRELVPA